MTIADQDRPIEILLVEDNPADVRLTQELLNDGKIRNHLSSVDDGVKALSFLRQLPPYENAPLPGLILLDLNLPKKGGQEVLQVIKADERLKRIPVVVLTTSLAEDDILRAYDLHANCYIVKPIDLDQFMTVLKSIETFWLTIVKLPSESI